MANIREQAMSSLKQYRSGWVILGESLKTIEEQELFNDWGFAAFKDYCKSELGITPATAKQMINAYEYIKKNEPNLLVSLGKNEVVFIPDYCSVNMLTKAYDKGEEKAVDRLHDKLFNEETGTKEGPEDIKNFVKEMRLGGSGDVADDVINDAETLEKKIESVEV
jgi:hypothetical protein